MNAGERRHPAFEGHNHPINVNFGTIEGGEWNSSVPTRARIGMRVGVMPGHSCREVAVEIQRMVAETATDLRLRGTTLCTEFKGFMADGCVFPADQAISRAVAAAHREVTGEELRHYAAPGLTDARFYVLYQDTEATCYGPDFDSIHGIDESVGLQSVADVTAALALTIAGWCGLESVGSAPDGETFWA